MGIYLSQPNKTKNSENGENSLMRYGVSAMQGWRMSMEDAHISESNLTENSSLFAVFDGHSGSEVASFCSDRFAGTLKENFNFQKGNYELALQETFLKLDEILMGEKGAEILKEYKPDQDMATSFAGCTANVVLFVDKTIYVANAGDSRCIVYTKKKEVVALSNDHKPDNEEEKKRIVKAGGYVSDGRVNDNLNLSRAIGDLEYKKAPGIEQKEQIISAFPDVQKREMGEDTYMIIGCDGIWETLQVEEICEFVDKQVNENKVGQLSVVVEELLDKLIAKDTNNEMGCDNMSCILIEFKQQ